MIGDDRTKRTDFDETLSEANPAQTGSGGAGERSQASPGDDGIPWGPLPDGGFRFSDNPSAEELRAYAEWDPKIKKEVSEKFIELAIDRARNDAIRRVYDAIHPEPPDLPRRPAPASRNEAMLALGHSIADCQQAVDYLHMLGRNRHYDVRVRIAALTGAARAGHAAAALGNTIDRLCRPIAMRPGRKNSGPKGTP